MLVSKSVKFCAGHTVTGHRRVLESGATVAEAGKCANLHGHNYVATFVYEGSVSPDGMVVDFNIIKNTIGRWVDENWDHRFLIWEKDSRANMLKDTDDSTVVLDFIPTAENMAQHLLYKANELCTGVICSHVILEETDSCKVEAS